MEINNFFKLSLPKLGYNFQEERFKNASIL